jgi:aminoglycoside phosphotransferase (APT) family kinase protein
MRGVSLSRLDTDEVPAALEPIARRMIPGAGQAEIRNWTATESGYSTETFLFDLVGVEGPAQSTLPLVFRRPPDYAILPDYDLRRQYLTMQRLAASPVPVPRVRWIDATPDALGTQYFVMDRVGDVISVSDVPSYQETGIYAEADADGRAKLWNGCVDMMAIIHGLRPGDYGLTFLNLAAFGSTPPQRLANFLRYGLNWACGSDTDAGSGSLYPTLKRGLDWLDSHLYEPDHVGLCWGDSRMSNILYRPDFSPVAVLDWEVAYLGDPAADVAWMLMTDWVSSPLEGRVALPGTPSREETIERYQRKTGRPIGNIRFGDVSAPILLAIPLIRLNRKLALDGVDLADICARRLSFILDGD